MKTYRSIVHVVGLAFACVVVAGCTTGPGGATAPPPNSGHVLIYRVANFGERLSLIVSVDGKNVGGFTEGRNYSGYLPAGKHTLTAQVDPNPGGTSPARKTVTIQAGQTYVYTAAWSGGGTRLVLVRGH